MITPVASRNGTVATHTYTLFLRYGVLKKVVDHGCLAEWSKASRPGRDLFGGASSNLAAIIAGFALFFPLFFLLFHMCASI